MKILISTPTFKPMVGGMEVLADNFAVHLTQRGHRVVLVTPIAAKEQDDDVYKIIRRPSWREFFSLVKDADLVLSNGASLYAAPWSMLARKPVVMRHCGYQTSAIDGSGWYDGQRAPLRPIASILFHIRNGRLRNTMRGTLKILALRLFAMYFVSRNIAISDWMKQNHPLPNQQRIYEPFPINKFVGARNSTGNYEYDFFFLGRLITEKGVDVLLEAFGLLQKRSNDKYRLCIIGQGPERKRLELIVKRTGQQNNVHFSGVLTGNPLVEMIRTCRIAILPSSWEEPFGGVSTELLAAEKSIITSRDGAFAEIVGNAGLTFPNGDVDALFRVMELLVNDQEMQVKQRKSCTDRLNNFNEENIIDEYVELFREICEKY